MMLPLNRQLPRLVQFSSITYATTKTLPPQQQPLANLTNQINKLPARTPNQDCFIKTINGFDFMLKNQPESQHVLFNQINQAIKKWTRNGLDMTPKLMSSLIKLSAHKPYQIITWISNPKFWGTTSPLTESDFELLFKNLFLYTLKTRSFRPKIRGKPHCVDQVAISLLGLMQTYGFKHNSFSNCIDYVVLICFVVNHQTRTPHLNQVISTLLDQNYCSKRLALISNLYLDLHMFCSFRSKAKPPSASDLMNAVSRFEQFTEISPSLWIIKGLGADLGFIYKPILKKFSTILFCNKPIVELTDLEMCRLYFVYHQILTKLRLPSSSSSSCTIITPPGTN